MPAAVAIEVLEERGQLLGRQPHAGRKHAPPELLEAKPPVAVRVKLSDYLLQIQLVQNVSLGSAPHRLQRLLNRAAEFFSELPPVRPQRRHHHFVEKASTSNAARSATTGRSCCEAHLCLLPCASQ